jgi:hypothetical protein
LIALDGTHKKGQTLVMIPFRACVYDLSFEREHSEVRWKYEESQKVSKNIHFIFDWPHS